MTKTGAYAIVKPIQQQKSRTIFGGIMVENSVYFNKVFKGYSPDEVESFIKKLNSDYIKKQQENYSKIKLLNTESEQLRRELEEALFENKDIKNLLVEKERVILELTESLDRAKAELTSRPKQIIANGQEQSVNRQTQQQILTAEAKAEEIISEAKRKAEEIVAKEREKATRDIKKLTAETKRRSQVVLNNIETFEKKQSAINAGLEHAKKHLGESIKDLDALSNLNEKE